MDAAVRSRSGTTAVISPLRPLVKAGRSREPVIEAQIRALLVCSDLELESRLSIADRADAGFVSEEAAVYLLRERHRAGDGEGATRIAERLVARSAGYVSRQIAAWNMRPHSHADDCMQDIYADMLQCLFDLSPGAEFWEVRFWLCLKRRVTNVVHHYAERRQIENSLTQARPDDDDQAQETDISDEAAPSGFARVEDRDAAAEALSQLPPNERATFVLRNYEGLPQEEIGRILGVSERQVRNRLVRADRLLRDWRARQMQ